MIIIVMIIVTAILVCVDQMIKIWAVGELAAKGISKPSLTYLVPQTGHSLSGISQPQP